MSRIELADKVIDSAGASTVFPRISAHALISALPRISAHPLGHNIKQAPPLE